MRVFKYLEKDSYARALLDGSVLFRPLAYYRQHEGDRARGDPAEAILSFEPAGGVVITRSTGEPVDERWFFDSLAEAKRFHVFCTSMVFNEQLGREFNAVACVAINDVDAFAARLEYAATGQKPSNRLFHGAVTYREGPELPQERWANPGSIVMSKRSPYSHQREYRFAFVEHKYLRPGATKQQLRRGDILPAQNRRNYPLNFLQLGNIRSLAEQIPLPWLVRFSAAAGVDST
jgi:hypothetical protein